MARPASFPLADLMAATTLDEAQARAVAACLGRELALVQGPPGTGELGAVAGQGLGYVHVMHHRQGLPATACRHAPGAATRCP
jgi:hypothetical protein